MRIIPRVSGAVESLLGRWAEEINQVCQVIQRQRKFTAAALARTFVLGALGRPKASDKELAETAALCGTAVTPQAIEQRFTPRLAAFLEGLFRRAIQTVIGTEPALPALLERFTSVLVLDSTTVSLPPELRERFPGCGGSHGAGQAALKLQVPWDLKSGALQTLSIEAGRDCDYKTPLQSRPLPPGALRITDLGYFDTQVFEQLEHAGVFWLSRLQFGVCVFAPDGKPLRLLRWLSRQSGPLIDEPVRIGSQRQVACRLLAWRVPREIANRRRQKLIVQTRRKDGRTPSRERLIWCDWTILVTNVPAERLAPQEALVLYRARWQIELLFKRWKSQGLVAQLTGTTTVQQMVWFWARLLAVIVEHWLLLCTAWGDWRLSLVKASQLLRRHAPLLCSALAAPEQLGRVIETLKHVTHSTAQRNKRRRPSTFQLLYEPALLDYALT